MMSLNDFRPIFSTNSNWTKALPKQLEKLAWYLAMIVLTNFDNFLTGRTFANQNQAKTAIVDFIESWAPNFYADGINRLVLRW